MKSKYLSLVLFLTLFEGLDALTINEVMSNPIGDDSGREWIEIYNETSEAVDISSLSISIKGGTPISAIPVSGGTSLAPFSYAIIGSVVSGATKFQLDYPAYNGPLLRSSISLVNTGATSIDLKLSGSTVSNIASYTAAKEGSTYSLISGAYSSGIPTPGKENQAQTQEESTTAGAVTTPNQLTIPQMTPPSADIILYLDSEKIAVAGAPSYFTVSAKTFSGKDIDNMSFKWAFGEGGQKNGSTTMYRYLYPGRYITQVEGVNGSISATGRMTVKVISPDIALSKIEHGKYGSYIKINNPNTYDLDISEWKVAIDGVPYSFPKNTLLGTGETVVPGQVLGFASTSISSSTIIKLLFPTMEEVVRVVQGEDEIIRKYSNMTSASSSNNLKKADPVKKVKTTTFKRDQSIEATSTQKILVLKQEKEKGIASFFKSLFK